MNSYLLFILLFTKSIPASGLIDFLCQIGRPATLDDIPDADQAELDYKAFVNAVREGRVKTLIEP